MEHLCAELLLDWVPRREAGAAHVLLAANKNEDGLQRAGPVPPDIGQPLWNTDGGEALSHFTESVFKIVHYTQTYLQTFISNIHKTEQAPTHASSTDRPAEHAHAYCMDACTREGQRGSASASSLLHCGLFKATEESSVPGTHSIFAPHTEELLSAMQMWLLTPRELEPTGCSESKRGESQHRSAK